MRARESAGVKRTRTTEGSTKKPKATEKDGAGDEDITVIMEHVSHVDNALHAFIHSELWSSVFHFICTWLLGIIEF